MKTYKDIAGDGGSNVAGQVTEQLSRLKARMASVRHVVAVMSGKGGVGKSTLTVNLACALALDGHAVGLLDADINGPSLGTMAGVRGQAVRIGKMGAEPAVGMLGIKVMSMDLFLPDGATPVLWEAPTQHDAYTWRGMMEAAAVREFLADTAWGPLDVLLVDLPPGTQRLPDLVDLVPHVSGVIVVTIPSEVSQDIVGKSVRMARAVLDVPVIGLVENMSGYICIHCGKKEALFPAGRVEEMAAAHGVPFLGSIPFDPRLAVAADEGVPFLVQHGTRPAGEALRHVAERTTAFLAARSHASFNRGE